MPLNIVRNDITKMQVDVIVNPANRALQAGGGACGMIFESAGMRKLQDACDKLAPIEIGGVAVTRGFDLYAKFIIHTVGPIYSDGQHNEENLLRLCYKNSLDTAKKYNCESIAFPLISSGIFGYPKDEALSVATSAIGEWLMENDMEVFLVVFDMYSFILSKELHSNVQSFIDENFINTSVSTDKRNKRFKKSERKKLSSFDKAEKSDFFSSNSFLNSQREKINEKHKIAFQKKERFVEKLPQSPKPSQDEKISEEKYSQDESVQDNKLFQSNELIFFGDYSELNKIDVAEEPIENENKDASVSEKLTEKEISEVIERNEIASSDMYFSDYSNQFKDIDVKLDESFSDMLFRIIDFKNKTDVEVYKRANVDRKLFSKIRSVQGYTPSKKTIIALAVSLELNLSETRELLECAGFALSRSMLFDVIIEHFIIQENYDIFEINNVLFKYDQALLG